MSQATVEPARGVPDGAPIRTLDPAPMLAAIPNHAMVRAAPASLLMVLPGASNAAVARVVEPDPYADPGFHPETIVDELMRSIDSHDTYVRTKPSPDLPPPKPFEIRWPVYEEVRKIDAAKAAALADLTPSQAAVVRRRYSELNAARALEQDLFGGGASDVPSDLTAASVARLRALLLGTKAEPAGPGDTAAGARLAADAAELRQLLGAAPNPAQRERVMALLRRPGAERSALVGQYQRSFGAVLHADLAMRLGARQLARALLLLAGDDAGADAMAVADRLAAVQVLDRDLASTDSSPVGQLRAAQLAEQRTTAVTALQADLHGRTPEEIAALLARTTAAGSTLDVTLLSTLGSGAGSAILAYAGRDAVAAAAYELVELEQSKRTRTERIREVLTRLRTAAGEDVKQTMFDAAAPIEARQRIAADPVGAVEQTARDYTARFVRMYDTVRGPGRTWAQIVDSADPGNDRALDALIAGGGRLTPVQELELAVSHRSADEIVAALAVPGVRGPDLEAGYDALPTTKTKLRVALFGPPGDPAQAATAVAVWQPAGAGLLHGRNAARAGELLGRDPAAGASEQVAALAAGGRAEVGATEATSGLVGSLRELGDDPETQVLMNRSAAEMTQLQQGFDPWAPNAAAELARARRLRATITGDASAYEEENAALRAKLQEAASLIITTAIGLAIPGLGYGFAASLALNITGTVVTNAVIYGPDYNGTRLVTDIFTGLVSAGGGKLGEEALGAVAKRVAARAAPALAAAAERQGLQTALRAGVDTVGGQVERTALEEFLRWGGDYAGSTAAQSLATGHNEFGVAGLGQNLITKGLSWFVPSGARTPGHAPAPEHPAPAHPAAEPSAPTPVAEPPSPSRQHGEPAEPGAAPESATPAYGGMRGDVLPVADAPVLQLSDLGEVLGTVISEAGGSAPLLDQPNFEHPPTFVGPVMQVDVLSPAAGVVPAQVAVVLTTGSSLAGAGVHGSAQGRAANRISFDGTRWYAEVIIDPRLSRADARIAVRHELNEVAGIVGKLHEQVLAGRLGPVDVAQAVRAQQSAGLTRPGTLSSEPTVHDQSTARDLGELYEAYRREPSAANEASLDRQIEAMGFGSRWMGQERTPGVGPQTPGTGLTGRGTRDQLVRDQAGPHAEELLDYIARWRVDHVTEVPYDPAARGTTVDLARQYTRAIADQDQGVPGADATMDAIERQASDGTGPPHLYVELESLFVLRRRAAGDRAALGPAGQRVDSPLVQTMTAGGPIEGASLAEIVGRVSHPVEGIRLAKRHTGDPPKPDISTEGKVGGGEQGSRLTWTFETATDPPTPVGSVTIDFPGVQLDRSYATARRAHVGIEVMVGGQSVHVGEDSVVLPAGTLPAHLLINDVSDLRALIMGWRRGQKK